LKVCSKNWTGLANNIVTRKGRDDDAGHALVRSNVDVVRRVEQERLDDGHLNLVLELDIFDSSLRVEEASSEDHLARLDT